MKIYSVLLGALLAVEASCAATPRADDYSQLQALLEQAQETAKQQLEASQNLTTRAPAKPGQPKCTLENLQIRREW